MITNEQIQATNAFKSLDKVTKDIYSKKPMMDLIKRELPIAKTIGIEKYNDKYNPRPYVLNVIKELLNDNQHSFSKCPECLQPTTQDELDVFGGLCEECSGAFD